MERIEQLKELYKSSFDDSDAYVDWFFENKYREDHVVSLADNAGQILSALHLVERRIVLGGKSLRCPFVVAAATLPEFRGQGNFEKVMLSALYGMNEQGIVLTELFPVNHKYYLKYGFVTAGKFRVHKVPERKVSEGTGACTVRVCGKDDAEWLYWLYHSYVRDANADGYCDRTKADFAQRLDELAADGGFGCLVFREENGLPVGYYFEESDGNVPELVLSDYAILGEIGALAGHSVTLPLWIERGRELPGNQARIVNVKKLLSLLRFDKSVCAAIRLRIRDSVLCHNNVTLSLVIAQGEVMVEECAEWDYEVSVEDLTRLVFGTYALYKNELPEKLCEVFGQKNNICWEKF